MFTQDLGMIMQGLGCRDLRGPNGQEHGKCDYVVNYRVYF